MAIITIDILDGALSALRLSPNEFAKAISVAAALLWYSRGEVPQAKAAEIAGTSSAEPIDQLAHDRIPVVQTTRDEFEEEMALRVDTREIDK